MTASEKIRAARELDAQRVAHFDRVTGTLDGPREFITFEPLVWTTTMLDGTVTETSTSPLSAPRRRPVLDPLTQLKRDAAKKRKADLRVRLSLAAALEAGHTFAEVARVLGVSRQAVRQMMGRSRI